MRNNDTENKTIHGMADMFKSGIQESQGNFQEEESENSPEALQGGKAVADLLNSGGKTISKFASFIITVVAIIALLIALEIVALMYMPSVGYEILYKVNDLWQLIPRK